MAEQDYSDYPDTLFVKYLKPIVDNQEEQALDAYQHTLISSGEFDGYEIADMVRAFKQERARRPIGWMAPFQKFVGYHDSHCVDQ